MGETPDYVALATEVLGIRNAPPPLARRLVTQALVIEDRREAWLQTGARIAASAPAVPGVYVLRDADGQVLYVGKAINLRRRLRTHFAARRWRGLKAPLARAAQAEWQLVGSELEALLREAVLIRDLQPTVNVQVGAPNQKGRDVPAPLQRDVVVVLPSVEERQAELVAARTDGQWLQVRVRRDAESEDELAAAVRRLVGFFQHPSPCEDPSPFAPIVFSWLAYRGGAATRLDPQAWTSFDEAVVRMKKLLADKDLFTQRLELR